MKLSFLYTFYLVISINLLLLTCNNQEDQPIDSAHDFDKDDYHYDHSAILGRKDSEMFYKLSPEESKAKLSEIIDKMDLDHDGKIDVFELKSWLKKTYQNVLDEDVAIQWQLIAKDGAEKVDFQSFLNNALNNEIDNKNEKLVKIEERRWVAADLDKDNLLNKSEMLRFLHPEEFVDLKPLLAQESLDELDKNNDGFVDIDEYMKDIFPEGREIKSEWIRHERQNFGIDRDMNKDGYLDREEIQNWLMPENYDRIGEEAEHIMVKAGAGIDRIMTKTDMLDKYYIFVGSNKRRPHEQHLSHEDL